MASNPPTGAELIMAALLLPSKKEVALWRGTSSCLPVSGVQRCDAAP